MALAKTSEFWGVCSPWGSRLKRGRSLHDGDSVLQIEGKMPSLRRTLRLPNVQVNWSGSFELLKDGPWAKGPRSEGILPSI